MNPEQQRIIRLLLSYSLDETVETIIQVARNMRERDKVLLLEMINEGIDVGPLPSRRCRHCGKET